MRLFRDYLCRQGRVLFVSKGPSADHAKDCLDFGHVATMNDSSRLIPGPIDYATMGDLEALLDCRETWPRIKTFLIPDYFHVNSAKSAVQASWIPGFPAERALLFPIEPIIYTDDATREAVMNDSHLALCNSATIGVHMLALLGYRQIWCWLGCDGGQAGRGSSFSLWPRRQETIRRHGTAAWRRCWARVPEGEMGHGCPVLAGAVLGRMNLGVGRSLGIMRGIGIVQAARLASKRVPQKMLEVVGGQRLIDRGLMCLSVQRSGSR